MGKILLTGCLLAIAIWLGCSPAPKPGSESAATPVASAPATQGGIVLSPNIPSKVVITEVTPAAIEQDFDVFSWNSFISLIWPPGPDGNGDPNQKPGQSGDNATVFEGWIDLGDIFLDGGKPPAWGAPPVIPPACQAVYHKGEKILAQVGKTPNLLTAPSQPFKTGPLIDQNKVYSRFEILANRTMFDYILNNKLYSKAGQQAFTGSVSFPCGDGTAVGSIMVKGAWKVLGPGDDSSHFHQMEALVYTAPSANPPVKESCTTQQVGLVGFHVGHRITISSQWVWSTFEQVDNAPDEADVKNGTLKAKYNYYNPACKSCPVNTPAPKPWVPNVQDKAPTQVVRVAMLPEQALNSAKQRNQDGQALLAGVSAKSVWQYYQLISTQWPTQTNNNCTANPANPNGTPFPQFLANATLETYVQGTTPQSSSSCINCHGNATMTTGAQSDFTFLLQNAK